MVGRAIVRVLMWSYERGSWQYDVMCALIVVFILFVPRGFFRGDFSGYRPMATEVWRQAPAADNMQDPETGNEQEAGNTPAR